MNSKHYRPQSVLGPHPSGRRDHPTIFSGHPQPLRNRHAHSFARTHARNANASAIEIDFPVRVRSNDCITPSTSDLGSCGSTGGLLDQ